MRKRQKMVATSMLLGIGLLLAQATALEWRYVLICLFTAATWVLASWSLKDGLSGIEWLTVPLPSVLFTAGVGLFYILLPASWLYRAGVMLFFGIGQYALLLTANIFSVAAIRTIALFRAALAVGFVMTLVTGFFGYNTIWSFKLPFWAVGGLVAVASWALILPALWSVKLEQKLNREVFMYSVYLALGVGGLAMAIAFWPITITVASLFLCTVLYILVGITQHYLSDRLFPRMVWEYVTIGGVVVATVLLTAGWGV
jgi:hypothetical protein